MGSSGSGERGDGAVGLDPEEITGADVRVGDEGGAVEIGDAVRAGIPGYGNAFAAGGKCGTGVGAVVPHVAGLGGGPLEECGGNLIAEVRKRVRGWRRWGTGRSRPCALRCQRELVSRRCDGGRLVGRAPEGVRTQDEEAKDESKGAEGKPHDAPHRFGFRVGPRPGAFEDDAGDQQNLRGEEEREHDEQVERGASLPRGGVYAVPGVQGLEPRDGH